MHLCRLHIILENYVLIVQTVTGIIKMCTSQVTEIIFHAENALKEHCHAISVSCKMQKDVAAQPKNNEAVNLLRTVLLH